MVRVGWVMGDASFGDLGRKNTEQKICLVYGYVNVVSSMIVISRVAH